MVTVNVVVVTVVVGIVRVVTAVGGGGGASGGGGCTFRGTSSLFKAKFRCLKLFNHLRRR